jgi:hypothetical protein
MFRKTTLLLIGLCLLIGCASATVTGNAPNLNGQTNISQNTVWDGEDVSFSSLKVTATTPINFTIQNSNITATSGFVMGTANPINFTLENSTITFAPPSYNSYSNIVVQYGYINTVLMSGRE